MKILENSVLWIVLDTTEKEKGRWRQSGTGEAKGDGVLFRCCSSE